MTAATVPTTTAPEDVTLVDLLCPCGAWTGRIETRWTRRYVYALGRCKGPAAHDVVHFLAVLPDGLVDEDVEQEAA